MKFPFWGGLRLKEAEEMREEFLRELHIANVRKHAPRNVLASLWWLERKYPNEFALRTVNRNISSHELVLDRVSPEQLVEDIRLAKEVEKERPKLGDSLPAADTDDSAVDVPSDSGDLVHYGSACLMEVFANPTPPALRNASKQIALS